MKYLVLAILIAGCIATVPVIMFRLPVEMVLLIGMACGAPAGILAAILQDREEERKRGHK